MNFNNRHWGQKSSSSSSKNNNNSGNSQQQSTATTNKKNHSSTTKAAKESDPLLQSQTHQNQQQSSIPLYNSTSSSASSSAAATDVAIHSTGSTHHRLTTTGNLRSRRSPQLTPNLLNTTTTTTSTTMNTSTIPTDEYPYSNMEDDHNDINKVTPTTSIPISSQPQNDMNILSVDEESNTVTSYTQIIQIDDNNNDTATTNEGNDSEYTSEHHHQQSHQEQLQHLPPTETTLLSASSSYTTTTNTTMTAPSPIVVVQPPISQSSKTKQSQRTVAAQPFVTKSSSSFHCTAKGNNSTNNNNGDEIPNNDTTTDHTTTADTIMSVPTNNTNTNTTNNTPQQQHSNSHHSHSHSQQHQHHHQQPPLLEIPEEIYAVRKAALQVLKPLNKTWVVISVGFALTVLFGMARWTRLLPHIPYWFIVLPCWMSHIGLLWLHILSAKALSAFIAEANESRQRPDSRDHLNRTEYLPLLQRSLKFGLKTGLLSFCIFIFEILMYIRVSRNSISLGTAFAPLWLLVTVGILDGLICKTQHLLRVLCWILTFSAMIMTVLKVDYGYDSIRWRLVVSPVITVLSIASCSLIYIVYGHQIGFYRLTESQLTAGNLYSLAALICIVLIVIIGEVIPLNRPVEIETRLMVVMLAPLVVSLVGMGAWVVSRDEFGRFLLYGGQSAVHPKKLKWETVRGWTCVQGKGVTVIPMFGEVAFQPLEKKPLQHSVEMLQCCTNTCYPTIDDDEDEEMAHLSSSRNSIGGDDYHPYLDTSYSSQQRYNSYRGSSRSRRGN